MKTLGKILSLLTTALRHAWVGLVALVALALGWLLHAGLEPVGGAETREPGAAQASDAQPPDEPERIRGDEPPRPRVVVAEVVIV